MCLFEMHICENCLWEKIIICLLVAEVLLLIKFAYEWFNKKKKSNLFSMLLLAFSSSFALLFVPYLHDQLTNSKADDALLGLMECVSASLKAMVGEWNTEMVTEFAADYPLYYWAYGIGAVLAVGATINAALQTFSMAVRNHFRLTSALKRKSCDMVLGTCENALRYAKDGAAVVIPEADMDKDGANRLVEQGYIVLRRSFSKELLKSRLLNGTTRYHIVCPGDTAENLDHINTFVQYRKSVTQPKNVHMFVRFDEDKAKTIRTQIVERGCCRDSITVFCANELLARRFVQDHPITQYMPQSFIADDRSLRGDVTVGMVFLGFGRLNRQLYRHSIMNDQLVTWDGTQYVQKPLCYHLFDEAIDRADWCIDGLKKTLEQLHKKQEAYYPLPKVPYATTVYDTNPGSLDTLEQVKTILQQENSYFSVVLDLGDTYKSIEAGARLRNLMGNATNYHIFIRSESAYVEDEATITYLGDFDDIFSHNVIVNDGLSELAMKINEIYVLRKLSEKHEGKLTPKLLEQARRESMEKWNAMEQFTRSSNIYAAINLRLKLQLLGLDFMKADPERAQPPVALEDFYPLHTNGSYEDYFLQSKRNAVLAQEKNRWNAFHMIEEILPMARAQVTSKLEEITDEKTGETKQVVRTYTKDRPLTRHACIATFRGLDQLTRDLHAAHARLQPPCDIRQYDYYQYDDQLLYTVTELVEKLGYVLVKR